MGIEKEIHRKLIEEKKTVTFAESITGGRLAATITALAGASNYFLGGIVAYCNPMKRALLDVSEETLQKHGAVSRETALEMLEGVLKVTGADYAIAVTGIAGPTGGSVAKPVGTVWGAVGGKNRTPFIEHFIADRNGREEIILFTVERLLRNFSSYLQAE